MNSTSPLYEIFQPKRSYTSTNVESKMNHSLPVSYYSRWRGEFLVIVRRRTSDLHYAGHCSASKFGPGWPYLTITLHSSLWRNKPVMYSSISNFTLTVWCSFDLLLYDIFNLYLYSIYLSKIEGINIFIYICTIDLYIWVNYFTYLCKIVCSDYLSTYILIQICHVDPTIFKFGIQTIHSTILNCLVFLILFLF